MGILALVALDLVARKDDCVPPACFHGAALLEAEAFHRHRHMAGRQLGLDVGSHEFDDARSGEKLAHLVAIGLRR